MNNKVKALMGLTGDVKAVMTAMGIKQIDICRKLKVKPSTVSLIVSGKKTSARVRQAIARALGVKLVDLWPENSKHKKAA